MPQHDREVLVGLSPLYFAMDVKCVGGGRSVFAPLGIIEAARRCIGGLTHAPSRLVLGQFGNGTD